MHLKHILFIIIAIFSFFILLHFGVGDMFQAQFPKPDELIPEPKGQLVRVPGGTAGGRYDLFADFIPTVIRLSLEVAGAVMLGFLIYAGILLVISGAEENYKEKAKTIFYNVIIGAIIISVSYAIVYGLTRIQWAG